MNTAVYIFMGIIVFAIIIITAVMLSKYDSIKKFFNIKYEYLQNNLEEIKGNIDKTYLDEKDIIEKIKEDIVKQIKELDKTINKKHSSKKGYMQNYAREQFERLNKPHQKNKGYFDKKQEDQEN